MSKLKFFAMWPTDWNASIYYRLLVPIFSMQKQGLCDAILDRNDRSIDLSAVSMAASHSDVYMAYQRCDDGFSTICGANKKRGSYQRVDNSIGAAPIMVLDTDDDLFNVTPLNDAFKNLGIQVNGQFLEPSTPEAPTKIEVEVGDKKGILFEDHKNGFDIAANIARMSSFRDNLANADLVTCSTPRSEAYVKREVPSANTFVLPNCIDFDAFGHVDHRPNNRIKVLWQGSSSHHEDMIAIQHALGNVVNKYPEVDLIIWGAPYKFVSKHVNNQDQLIYRPWCQYYEYKLRMNQVGHDIAIAPLEPLIFNQSRSAIKAYESAACSKPAPTVCQKTGAYADEIIEGETGLLFETPDEFEEKISTLIENEKYRQTMGQNMKDWIRENRDPDFHARRYHEKLHSLAEARLQLVGPPRPSEEDNGTVSGQLDDLRTSEVGSS